MNEFVEEKSAILAVPTESLPNTADPVEGAEKACQELQKQVMVKTESEKQLEERVQCLQEKLEESRKQINSLKYRLEQAHDNESKQANRIREMEECHRKEVRSYERQLSAAENKQMQSIVWPCVMIAVFAVISLLTGTCANRGWMVSLLAEILICGELCVCTFFVGIVWNRLRDNKAIVNEKKQQSLSIGRAM